MIRYLIPLAIFLSLVVLFRIGLNYDPHRVPSPLIDKPAPEFSLPNLKDGSATVSLSDLKGQTVLLNVWASWCVQCRVEHPLLMEFARKSKVPVYGLNYKDTREDAMNWLARHGDPYRHSAFDESGRVGIDFGVYGVPETFVVDRNGIIRYKHIGPLSREAMQEIILPLLHRLNQPST